MHWDKKSTDRERPRKRRPMVAGALFAGHANAAPIEGELGINAAALLVVLGVWALVMGLRNLRELRHKRMAPERQQPPRHTREAVNRPL